jgi:hypothetical protein
LRLFSSFVSRPTPHGGKSWCDIIDSNRDGYLLLAGNCVPRLV